MTIIAHADVGGRRIRAIDPLDLIALVRARKGPVYAPKSVELLDALPLTPVGKADKKTLRARYWSGQTRRVS